MHVDPENCVVFEDTISGIKAAKAAEMKVIGVASTHTKEELDIADDVIGDFNEVTISKLKSL